jgi:hypothetical protein
MVVKELVALLGVKTDEKDQKKAEGGLNGIIGLAKVAVAAFAAIKAVKWLKGVIEETATLGDKFHKLAARSGLATQALQELEHAAELSGASLSHVEVGLKTLQRAQIEAADGVATYADEFKRMGLDIKNEDGTLKDTTQLFVEMADGLQGLKTDAERTAVAATLMGRGGTMLIPMLKDGSEALHEMMLEMRQLGGVMSDEMIQASADYVDNQRRVDVVIRGIKTAISKEVLPAVNNMMDGFIKWYKLNGQIIRQRMTEFFGKVGRVIVQNVKFWIGLVKTVAGFISNLDPMKKKILGLSVAIIALAKLVSMGPLGQFIALAGAIALVVEDFMVWKEGGESAIGAVMKKLYDFLGIDQSAEYEQWAQDMDFFADSAGQALEGLFTGALESGMNFFSAIGAALSGNDEAWQESVDRQKEIWNTWLPEIATGFEKLFGIDFPRSWQELTGIWMSTVKSWRDWWYNTFIAPIERTFYALNNTVDTILNNIKSSFISWVAGMKSAMPSWLQKWIGGGTKAVVTGGPTPRPGTAAGGGMAINNQTKVDVSVKATPGMDEKKLATEVGKRVKDAINKQNQETMRALTPLPAGPA